VNRAFRNSSSGAPAASLHRLQFLATGASPDADRAPAIAGRRCAQPVERGRKTPPRPRPHPIGAELALPENRCTRFFVAVQRRQTRRRDSGAIPPIGAGYPGVGSRTLKFRSISLSIALSAPASRGRRMRARRCRPGRYGLPNARIKMRGVRARFRLAARRFPPAGPPRGAMRGALPCSRYAETARRARASRARE